MVDLQWKSKLTAAPQISSISPPATLPNNNNNNNNKSPCNPPNIPCSPRVQVDASSIVDYEYYLRLPELFKLCNSRDFPDWKDESVLKPSLQALEITFRLISIALSDPRPYSNHREWKRRLESLTGHQIEIIAAIICNNDEEHGMSGAPIADLSVHEGVLAREKSSHQEVWKLNGTTTTLVSHTSEASLLPRLASWDKSEAVASKILLQIECQMHRCPFTLGLGEPNLAGKRSLEYDLIVRPADLHSLKKSPLQDDHHHRLQDQNQAAALLTIHQILESWLCTARQLLTRIGERIDGGEFDEAASDCWLLERIWKLMAEIEDLHMLMDPSDFLHLKSHLAIRATTSAGPNKALCFRSRALSEVTNLSKDLKHKVPLILGVEVDPNGGPRVQEAAMRLFHSRRRGGEGDKLGTRIHLLQAFQAMEASIKEFFFAYMQVLTVVMGSLEANGGNYRGGLGFSSDSLTRMFMDPPYFPSLDAAKTFLGELIRQSESSRSGHHHQ